MHPPVRKTWNVFVPIVLAACLLIGSSSPMQAQHRVSPEYVLSQWNVDQGLPVNSVTAMMHGADGFLWLATFDGLVRFDGSRFSVYSAATNPELPSNRFSMIFPGQNGEFWATSEQGQVVRFRDGKFDLIDDRFGLVGRHAVIERPQPYDVLTFPTTEGVGVYHPEGDTVVMHTGLRGFGEVTHTFPDGSFWVGGLGGRLAYVDTTGRIRQVGPSDQLQHDVMDLHVDRTGTLWVLTSQTLLKRSASGFASIAGPDSRPWIPEVPWLEEDAAGRIWVLDSSELYLVENDRTSRVRPDTVSLQTPVPPSMRGRGGHLWTYDVTTVYRDGLPVLELDGAQISSILFNADRSIWVATQRGGLLHLRQTPIRTHGEEVGLPGSNLYPVLVDRRQNVWVGTMDDGLGCFGAACPAVTSPSTGIFALHEESDGTLWAGGYGLYRLENNRFVRVNVPIPYTDRIRAVYRDRSGILWVGSELGLVRGRAQPDGSWQFDKYMIADGLTHDWVRLLTETRDGTLWAGTNGGGLMRIHSSEGPGAPPRFEAFRTENGLCSNNIRHLYEDASGILWIATEDRGLCRVDLKDGASLADADVVSVHSRRGLYDDALHHIAEDAFGRMWMSSNRGLFWVPKAQLTAIAEGTMDRVFSTVYTERDGLRNREFNGGVQPAGARDASGRLWFPSQDGLVSIDPAIVGDKVVPEAIIEALDVGTARLTPGTTISLDPNERDVRFEFAAAYFGHPDELWFRYRLRPYDSEWRYAGTERTAAYTNLEPGTYTFEIEAGTGGEWQPSPTSLQFARRPYFYETLWFYAVILLGLALGAFGIHGRRLHRLKQRRDELERDVTAATRTLTERNDLLYRQNDRLRIQEAQLAEQAQQLMEMDQAKTRFFANTSHELRTPLTLMLEPIRELREDGAAGLPAHVRSTLDLVYRNGQRLRRLINQMLDLSRLEAGGMQLDLQIDDLVGFLRRMVAGFESSARVNGLTLGFKSMYARITCPYDADALEKVVSNLLSNAIKFTPSGGRIEVSLDTTPLGEARIRITDTGPGIPREALDRIFDRFYQVDDTLTRHHEGSGIGLALSRELVLLHGGTIQADSPTGGGAVFTCTLPDADVKGAVVAGPGYEADSPADRMLDPVRDVAAYTTSRDDMDAPHAESDADETLVLVIEDNRDMRAYIATGLSTLGRVITATNGDEGMKRAYDEIPDLVVSDVMMPGSDGLELCSALKADPRTSHIPILLLTARADLDSRIDGFEHGADAYLAKPFSKPELIARTRGLLENRKRLHDHFQRTSLLTLPDVDLPSRDAQFLESLTRALEENLSDPDFTVERLADVTALSKRQLLRKLHAVTGQTPSDILRKLRMERAGAMLRQDAGSVKEIAYAVGYRSTSSFRKAFKEHFGTPPSELVTR